MKKNRIHRSLALILSVVLVLMPIGSMKVSAAALTSIKDTISDSRPSTAANHTISFVTPSGVAADGSTITVTFPAGFSVASITEDDVDVEDDSSDLTTAANCAGTEHAGVSVSGQVLTIQICSGDGGAIAASSTVDIKIGTNATASGTGANRVTNHATAAVYTIQVGGSMADSGDALIAIVDTVTASVTIDETLSFTVSAVTSGNCTSGNITTTATTVPFGTTTGNSFIDGCQQLEVSTNAAGGYNVTLVQSQVLTSGSNTISEGTCDGACSDTTFSTWATATNNGFGYCLEDVTGTDSVATAAQECDDATPEYKTLVTLGGTAESIMTNTGAVSGSQMEVNYRLTVPGNQPAGTYTNQLIYVATPTY